MKHVLFALSLLSAMPAFAAPIFPRPTDPAITKASAETANRANNMHMAIQNRDKSALCLNGGVVYANANLLANLLAQQSFHDYRGNYAAAVKQAQFTEAEVALLDSVCSRTPTITPAAFNGGSALDVLDARATEIEKAVTPFSK